MGADMGRIPSCGRANFAVVIAFSLSVASGLWVQVFFFY